MGTHGKKGKSTTKAVRLAAVHAPKSVNKATNVVEASAIGLDKPPKAATTPIRKAETDRPSPPPRAEKIATYPRSFWVAIGSLCLLALSVTSNIVTLWGPFWPTEPVFSLSYPSSGSPFEIPFYITNRSVIFPIHDIELSCYLKHITTNNNNIINNSFVKIQPRIPQVLEPEASDPYKCPLNSAFTFRSDDYITSAKI